MLVTKPFSHGLDASQDTEIGSQPGWIYNSSIDPWKQQLFLAVTLGKGEEENPLDICEVQLCS